MGIGLTSSLPAVDPIARLSREPAASQAGDDPKGEEAGKPDPFGKAGFVPPYDRRSSASIIDGAEAGTGAASSEKDAEKKSAASKAGDDTKPKERQIRDKLTELEGEKAKMERNRSGDASQRSSEVSNMVARLKARDGEVRAHESAHIAAGGRYITGGASFSYQKGPDGTQYAIGGEVGIDSSPVPGKPEETIAKMRIVRAAALAPTEPSGADLSVAGAAAQAEASAIAELAAKRSEDSSPGSRVNLVA